MRSLCSNSVILLETGECPLLTRAWWPAFKYWCKFSVFKLGTGLLLHLSQGEYLSCWSKLIAQKSCFNWFVFRPSLTYALKSVKQRLWDFAFCDLWAPSFSSCSPSAVSIQYVRSFYTVEYLKNLPVTNYGRLFTKARLNVFPLKCSEVDLLVSLISHDYVLVLTRK